MAVGTPAWYAWLEEAAQFTFVGQNGTFAARKERVANGRGGAYWRAYRKQRGKLYRVYLGKSGQLTLARLTDAARKLALQLEAREDDCAGPETAASVQSALSLSVAPLADREAARAWAAVPHLLRTKLHVPVFQTRLVARERLVQRLNVGMKQRLVLLSAAAGSGKTTLLSSWARQVPALVAWVALDAEDNDPVRFWSYVVAAFQRVSLSAAASILETLRSRPLPDLRPVLSDLLNMLDEEARELVLILDDYHVIEAQAIHDSLLFFLDHLPSCVHLVLASRYELPFSIAQLRARRQLAEIRSADLCFTLAEAESFFAETEHLTLARDDLKKLLERTEGWIAGLQLAALSLHAQEDTSAFISTFQGSHRFILDYLVDDVLARQSEQTRRFLLATAVLDRFTTGLCDALTGETNGAVLLAYLEERNLFLTPLDDDGKWYRYHHLLAEALRTRLRQQQPALFYELHRRASAWFERQTLLEEAVKHAFAATDYERAADLLERLVEVMLKQNEFASLARWQELLPSEVLARRPWLQLSWARVHIVSGRLDRAEEALRDLERAGVENVAAGVVDAFRGRVAALYAHLYGTRGEAQASLDYASRALDLLPADDEELRIGVRAAMGVAYLHAGRLVEAEQALSEVVAYQVRQERPVQALSTLHTLGQTQVLLGQPYQANATYLRGIQIVTSSGLTRSAAMGHIHAGLGSLLYEWNDLTCAQEHLVTGFELAVRGENTIQALDCTLTLADVRQAQGRMQEAFALLERAQELAGRTNDPFFQDFVARRPVFLWLAAHDVESAVRCARDTGLYYYGEVDDLASLPSTFFLLIELLILARLYLVQGDLTSAKRLLVQLQSPLMNGPNKRRRIQWLILQALALYAQDRLAESTMALAQALEMAEPLGYIRTFADMGAGLLPPLKILLQLKPLANYSQGYVRQLLSALGERDLTNGWRESGMGDELLGERELLVLRCLAEGCSDREIARRLVVSENTIKTHTRHIYSKLNVHSRTQAVARARERGLL